jgi:hypothetical protein
LNKARQVDELRLEFVVGEQVAVKIVRWFARRAVEQAVEQVALQAEEQIETQKQEVW